MTKLPPKTRSVWEITPKKTQDKNTVRWHISKAMYIVHVTIIDFAIYNSTADNEWIMITGSGTGSWRLQVDWWSICNTTKCKQQCQQTKSKLDGDYDSIDYYASANTWQLTLEVSWWQDQKLHFGHIWPHCDLDPWPFDLWHLMCLSLPWNPSIPKVWWNFAHQHLKYHANKTKNCILEHIRHNSDLKPSPFDAKIWRVQVS